MHEKSCGILINAHPGQIDTFGVRQTIIDMQKTCGKIYLYFLDQGVYFLNHEFWVYFNNFEGIMYANGEDARKYHVPFREEIVFSGIDTLTRLMKTCSIFYTFNADEYQLLHNTRSENISDTN